MEILTVEDPADFGALYEHVERLFDVSARKKLGARARSVALQHPFEKNVAEILQLYNARSRRRAAA